MVASENAGAVAFIKKAGASSVLLRGWMMSSFTEYTPGHQWFSEPGQPLRAIFERPTNTMVIKPMVRILKYTLLALFYPHRRQSDLTSTERPPTLVFSLVILGYRAVDCGTHRLGDHNQLEMGRRKPQGM